MAVVGIKIGGTFTLEVGPHGRKPVNVLTLPVTPNQSVALFFRTTVTQTQRGLWVDRFGMGPTAVTIQGTSAWDSPDGNFNGQHVDGNTAVRHLVMDILEYYEREQVRNPNSQVLLGVNGVTGETWELEPVGQAPLTRSESSPLEISYTVQFVVLKDLSKGPVAKAADAVAKMFSSRSSVAQNARNQVAAAQRQASAQKRTPYIIREVKANDTLYTIAQSYLPKQATKSEVTALVDQIVALNNLSNPNLIFTGLWLKIPH